MYRNVNTNYIQTFDMNCMCNINGVEAELEDFYCKHVSDANQSTVYIYKNQYDIIIKEVNTFE